jgi:hypothetical protein
MGLVLTGELAPKLLKTRRRLADVYERQATACVGNLEDKVIVKWSKSELEALSRERSESALGKHEPAERPLWRSIIQKLSVFEREALWRELRDVAGKDLGEMLSLDNPKFAALQNDDASGKAHAKRSGT